MAEGLRVVLELGKKRRVAAGAIDWPGLDRWGTSEDGAVARVMAYVPRYAAIAARAGMTAEFSGAPKAVVVERVPGSSSTDFWGVAHVPSQLEAEVLSADDLERRLTLVQACWASFDELVARLEGIELLPSGRSGGRSRDQIARHVYLNEPDQFSRKVEVRTPFDVVLTPDGLREHRRAYLDAIRAYNAESRPARTWPIQFLLRRTANHVMDHGWEIEDRDPTAAPA